MIPQVGKPSVSTSTAAEREGIVSAPGLRLTWLMAERMPPERLVEPRAAMDSIELIAAALPASLERARSILLPLDFFVGKHVASKICPVSVHHVSCRSWISPAS